MTYPGYTVINSSDEGLIINKPVSKILLSDDKASLPVTSQSLTTFTVPPGAVMSFATIAVPSGWLECNGSSISRTTYANLFSVIGTSFGSIDSNSFNLPDLRGQFVRGWANTSNVDIGRTFGSQQGDTIQAHQHSFTLTERNIFAGQDNHFVAFTAETNGNGATGYISNETSI